MTQNSDQNFIITKSTADLNDRKIATRFLNVNGKWFIGFLLNFFEL